MKCAGGAHLIGLFLNEEIPNGLSVGETADRIRAQGGVVYAPHPFAYLRSAAERARAVLAVADVVEVFNARAFLPRWNRRAVQQMANLNIPCVAGTDAHTPWEIGQAYTEIPPFSDAASFRQALQEARPGRTHLSSIFMHTFSITSEVLRRAAGRGHGAPPGFRK